MLSPRYRVASPPARKPLLLWDGECGFCRLWAERWGEAYGEKVDLATSQSQAGRFPEIPADAYAEALQLIEVDGNVYSGAAAALRTRRHGRGSSDPMLWAYEKIPGGAQVCDAAYGLVARHRPFFSLLTRWLCGPDLRPPRYSVSAGVFLRGLALVYAIAFASFWWQLDGLIGRDGILPAQPFLDAVAGQLGAARYWAMPTLCWIFGGGWFLHFICASGLVLAGLLWRRIAQPACLLLLWMFYLSLCGAGQVFLGYQWDALLLETGLLAVMLAPWGLTSRHRPEPPPAARWLLGWLLFRLMFMSGFVKLASGDSTWRNLTALTYHYQTQPLPTGLAWYAHQLPPWFQEASCAVMFTVELLGPFLLFGPRRLRRVAAVGLIGFQLLIALTGNYTFFNLLTVLLCLLFLDDAWWSRCFNLPLRPDAGAAAGREARPARSPAPGWLHRAAITALLAASLVVTLPAVLRLPSWPGWFVSAYRIASATRSVNSYGLFAVMTTTRPEIIIEGSLDGLSWAPYEFKWKPGELARRPGFVAPYQPRLDWQLWFAALEEPRANPWMNSLFAKLAANVPAVTALLQSNPFAQTPPHYLRAVLYDYQFTTPAERARTGDWWKRSPSAYYLPPTRVR
jgi:predicted DCC family thiol-disulfide oxidoreductase YuxK